MDFSTFHSAWTLLVFGVFVAIALWAFSPSRREGFEQAGRSVLEEDDAPKSRREQQ